MRPLHADGQGGPRFSPWFKTKAANRNHGGLRYQLSKVEIQQKVKTDFHNVT